MDKDLAVVEKLAKAVAELPESVQQRAFEVLIERHLGTGEPVPAEQPSAMHRAAPEVARDDWRGTLAHEAGVDEEHIATLLERDGEDVYVVTPELGDTEADRTRNIAVLVLWATRVLTRDIYAPQSIVYAALRRHSLRTSNVTNNLRKESCVKSVKVAGEKMFQLVGDWRERAADIIRAFGAS
jgi:hypothetical protein